MVTNEDACAGGDASSSSTQLRRAEVEWRRRRLTTTTNKEHGGVDARIAGETSSTTTTWQVRPQTVRGVAESGVLWTVVCKYRTVSVFEQSKLISFYELLMMHFLLSF